MGFTILIDGYNLIAALWGMGCGARELERQRQDLLRMLAGYRQSHPVHVVFDGWREGSPLGGRSREEGILVSFSPKGVTADELIRDLLAEPHGAFLVVSDDRTVQRWSEAAGAQSVPCRTFIGRLEQSGRNTGEVENEPGDEDGWAGDTKKRGNPRRLSKKDRARERHLKKL